MRLRVTDLTGATDEQVATITVAESNRAPTAISLSNAAVAENFAGATVGQVQVTDPDVNQDGFVAPLDVLKIFNALNAQAGAGEAASTTPMAFESAEGTPQASDADCDSLFSDVETLEWVLTSANWSPATWADWDPERRKRAS